MNQELPTIEDIPDLAGKRVIVRTDFDVSLGDNNTVDDYEAWRIIKSLRTIQYLRDKKARVIVVSHIGREGKSLRPVADYINRNTDLQIGFVPEVFGDVAGRMVDELPHGGVLLLENLRQDKREEENDKEFAKSLAAYGEIYVNEAFATCHREHASIVGLPRVLPAYAGFQLLDEIVHLEKVRNPERPLTMVLGGAKFETKLRLLEEYIDVVDRVFVGGALANKFLQEQGHEIGNSLVDESIDITHVVNNPKIVLPRDVEVTKNDPETSEVTLSDEIEKDERVVDIG